MEQVLLFRQIAQPLFARALQANFSVTANGPDPVYQWWVSADGGLNSTIISAAKPMPLFLYQYAGIYIDNRYRCQISNGCTIPAIAPTQSSDSICCLPAYRAPAQPFAGSGASGISATAGPGETIDWYALASGGSSTKPDRYIQYSSLNATTIYYAEAGPTTGCVSATRTVTATVRASRLCDSGGSIAVWFGIQ